MEYYFWQHLISWTLFILIFSGPIYATGKGDMTYIDALFYSTSAWTGTGLTTTDLSQEKSELKC